MNIDIDTEARAIEEQQAALDMRKQAVAAEQRKRLAAEHKVIVGGARAAKDEFERLTAEADELQRQTFRTRGAWETAERSLANHRASAPKATDYPTETEMEKWRRELNRREAAVKRALEADAVPARALLVARMLLHRSEGRITRIYVPPAPKGKAHRRVQ